MSAQKWDHAANLPNPPPTLTRPPPFPCSLAYLRSGGGDSNVNEGDLNGDEVIGLTDMGNMHTNALTRTQNRYLAAKPRLQRRTAWEI